VLLSKNYFIDIVSSDDLPQNDVDKRSRRLKRTVSNIEHWDNSSDEEKDMLIAERNHNILPTFSAVTTNGLTPSASRRKSTSVLESL
jgi:hypothetical protein